MFKNRRSGIAFLLMAVVCGLAAAIMTGWLLVSYSRTVDVLVVTKDIEPYEQLDGSVIGVVSLPAAAVPSDAVFNLEDVNGKHVRFGLARESVLRSSHLLDGEYGGPLAAVLSSTEEPQARAFALPYGETVAIGGAVRKEDRIDLIASLSVSGISMAKIIARNVRVIDVVSGGEGISSIVVTVTPEQAEELAFLLENGKVYAALNPYDADLGAAATQGFYTADAFLSRHQDAPEVPVPEEPFESEEFESEEEGEEVVEETKKSN